MHGRPPLLLEAADEDKDVQAERERVESGRADVDVVQLQSLSKIYHLPLRRIMAVKNVSIGIPAGEVSKQAMAVAASPLENVLQATSSLSSQSLLKTQGDHLTATYWTITCFTGTSSFLSSLWYSSPPSIEYH